MLSLFESTINGKDRFARREVLRAGSLGAAGLSLPSLLQAREASTDSPPSTEQSFGRAKNVIFLYLAGGPPQHETFDPKPDAPSGIRGPFNPISTNIPGIHFSELLPRTASIADKLAVVRSMATDNNVHSSSGAWVLTGYKYLGSNARTISPTDWPYFGSVVKMLKPSDTLPALSSVWVPDMMRLNENVTPAGQTGGFLGSLWSPEVFVGDPSASNYEIESLRKSGITSAQLDRRQRLLSELETNFGTPAGGPSLYDTFQQQAFDLLTSGKARQAFDIRSEADGVRNRYGRNRWGQTVLLARRLIESGVRLVHVQWPREPGDNAVDNPLWDTHAQNADRLEDVLCPMFDVGFSALVEDLDQRGLLDETLVVAIGEFGRTPKINAKGGRDHWGHVFSFAMAGAGISGGQVIGSSDRTGGYPTSHRVDPGNLSATIFHLLGMNYQGAFEDRQGRQHRLTTREPIWPLLGSAPATDERISSTGDVLRVPPFDPTRHLMNVDFSGADVLKLVTEPSRPKGWRVSPTILSDGDDSIGVKLLAASVYGGTSDGKSSERRHAAIGFNLGSGQSRIDISKGTSILLAQEVRSPFAGTYRFRVRMHGEGSSAESYRKLIAENFTCQLCFFQFASQAKRADQGRDLATIAVAPQFVAADGDGWQTFELSKTFVNPRPGSNFSFGSGLGVSIRVIASTDIHLPDGTGAAEFALIRIADVSLEFLGKEVNENVTV